MAKNDDELGALWIRNSAKGQYMTGNIIIDGVAHPIVCFTNQHKKSATQPDWRILKSRPKEETQYNNPLPTKQDDTALEYPHEEINPEDIPF